MSKKVKAPKQNIWRDMFVMLKRVKLPWIWLLVATVVALGSTELALKVPSYMQQFYAGDYSDHVILMLAVTGVLRYVIVKIADWINSLCSASITMRTRKSLMQRLLRMPVRFYEDNTPKSLISRTTDDTTKMSDFISKFLSDTISSVYGIYGTIALLFTFGWQLGVTAIAMIPLTVIFFFICGKLNFWANQRVQSKLAQLTKAITERVLRLPLIKSTVNEDAEQKAGTDDIDAFYQTKRGFGNAMAGIATLQLAENYLRDIIVIFVGFFLVTNEVIGIDVFIAFYMFVTQFSGYILKLMGKYTDIKGCQGAVSRIAQIYTESEENTAGEAVTDKAEDIRFENVSFAYNDQTVLENASFTIPSKQLTAIVGKSGAGKSTILKLLAAFYALDNGAIKVGSQVLDGLDKHQWRKSIGYVSQEMALFSGTVMENLLYGIDRKISDADIKKAISTACAEFVYDLPEQLGSQVGQNGSRLSGGQSRRIMIANALLKDCNYLLLDEITSNLDVPSRRAVDQAIRNCAKEKTVILVSHDMKAVEQADQILVLDQKHIVASGNHSGLMNQNTLYQQLQAAAD